MYVFCCKLNRHSHVLGKHCTYIALFLFTSLLVCMFTGLQRPEVSIRFLSQLLSTLILIRGLSLNWRLLILVRSTREQALGILLSLPFHYYNDGCTLMSLAFLHGYWRSNRLPFLHDSILPTEPSPRLHTFHFETESQKIAQADS